MRYLTSLGLCLLALTVLGCNNQTQPLATPPAEEKASSGEAVPAVHNATQTGKEHESREANENGGFGLDVDVGQGGVHVDTEGPNEKSGVRVDVDPNGKVDVDVGKKPSGETNDSST